MRRAHTRMDHRDRSPAVKSRGRAPLFSAVIATVLLAGVLLSFGCSDLREKIGPTVEFPPLTYVSDMKPIFDRDCVRCHNPNLASGDYDMSQFDSGAFGGILGTGSDDTPNVIPGNGTSLLIQVVDTGGSMRGFLGSAAEDAAKIRQWIVTDGAKEE